MGKFASKKKYEKTQTSGGSGDGIRRMKLIPGTNVVRIVEDNFEDAWVHHFQNSEGKNRREVCLGKDKCPICAADKKNRANHRFYFNVIDRKEQKSTGKIVVKLLECGKLIYEAIRDLALDEEYGNPVKYNLKIERKGEGKMDTKYSVRASTKIYDLTSEEKAAISQENSEGGAYDLSVFVTKKTKAELEAALTGEEADENIEEEEKPIAKKKAVKEDEEEEEDEEEDEEEEKPKSKKKVSKDDDEEEEELDIDKEIEELEDEDEDEDEEEEDEKPKKKCKKKTKDTDEEDEEEDF